MNKSFRIGQIVPSSNTTMETEIPAMLLARQSIRPERFTFHSSRMRMKKVVKEELAAMDAESDRCALELSDARVDVLGYACLVAIMAMGHGYHRISQERLQKRTAENGGAAPVLTSAGALVDALKVIRAKRIVVVAPYMKPLTELVVDYIRNEGFEVVDYTCARDPGQPRSRTPRSAPSSRHRAGRCRYQDVDAIVLSACVQMPSLPVVAQVEAMTGKPVITAAIATTYAMLRELDLERIVPGAGALALRRVLMPAARPRIAP